MQGEADPLRGRRFRPPALAAGAAALALLAAACGGARAPRVPTTSSSSSTHEGGALRFSACMRSHGLARFPDPSNDGSIPKVALERLGTSSARFQAAESSCRHLLPNGGRPTPAAAQRVRAEALLFSRCVRAHGVPSFPDPGSDGRIPDPASVGIDQGGPKFQAANDACGRYRPPYLPSNAAYESWARTH